MALFGLPDEGWSTSGENVAGTITDGRYRVTATASTTGRPGVRHAVDFLPETGRGYTVTLDVAYSANTDGPKRLTAYWKLGDFGDLPYGEGPYGAVALIARERSIPITDDEADAARYTFEGAAPEGATGLAFEVANDRTDTPWPTGAWMEVRASALDRVPVVLTPHADMSPVPRVNIRIDDADQLADSLTVYALDESGSLRPVAGGWRLSAASLLVLDDLEAPFNVPVTYSIQLHDESGGDLGIVTAVSAPIVREGTVVQQAIDPRQAVEVRLLATSAESLTLSHDGELMRPGSSRLPVWVGSGSWPLQGIPLAFGTETAEQYAAMSQVLGRGLAESVDYLPIIVVRTSHNAHLPQPLIALVQSSTARALDATSGGHLTHWILSADQVRRPSAAIVRPALTWADVMARYGTWDVLLTEHATWGALMLDYSIAGRSDA